MSDIQETDPDQDAPDNPAAPEDTARPGRGAGRSGSGRRRRGRRVGLLALIVMAMLVIGALVAAFALIGRPLVAPDWLKTRIETQVNAGLRGADIKFGELSLVVEAGWKPHLLLRDVDLGDGAGGHIVSLSDVESTLALKPLLRGELRPARIWLTGAQLLLRRDVSGQVGLSFGETLQPAGQAANMAKLIEEADRILEGTPGLASLRGVWADGLTIRYEDARSKRAWTVDGGRIELSRSGFDLTLRGDFALLGGGDNAASIEMNYQSRIGSAAAAFGMTFQDLATGDIAEQSAALLWLNALRAPISGALRASVDEAGNLGPLSATLQIGAGVLQPTDETLPVPFRWARSYFTYSPETQVMQFDEVSVDSAWGGVRAEGNVILGALEDGWPREFLGQLRLSEIRANPKDLYPEPVRFENATMDLRLQMNPFRLTLGEMTLTDQGQQLGLRGDLHARPEGWDLSLTGRMDRLSPERLLQLWPASLTPNTRNWIEANILAGTLSNIQLGLRSLPTSKPVVYLGFEFDKLDTLFMKTMPPIRGARGHASLYRNRFSVVADAGQITADQGGAVEISGTSFVIPDVRIKEAPAQVRLATRSTLTAALSLLDREPFHYLSKAGQPVTLADGRAAARGTVDLRLKKNLPPEEVDFDITAKLNNVRSETVVPGRVLAAAALDVTADRETLRVEGGGRIGQVPINGRFTAPLGKAGKGTSTVAGWVELSQRFVDEFRLGLPPGTVSGTGRGEVQIDLTRGERPRFELTSSLAGLGLRIAPIGWSLAKPTKGRLVVSGRLGEPMEVNRIELAAPGLRANGRLDLGPGGSFRSASFDRVQAGAWLDAPVTLVGRGVGLSPEVNVTGGTVDLSKTEIGSGSGGGATSGGGPINVALDRLQISEGISLTGFRGKFNTAKGMDGSFSGKVNGGTPVTGRVVPRKGRSAFRLLSDNAGGVFKSAGLLKSAKGGDFDLTLLPGGGEGSYDGTLKVSNIWLQDAPAMAALLNAISVIGLLEQLGGSGILFGEVDARFRLTPTQAIITKSSAIGASMGISMDGIYQLESGRMDMQGVVSPLYLINGIGSILTRKGEGLIGFNYNLRGTADKPRVKVNPLSLLTPGMFREIFRRPAPKVSE